MVQLMVGALPRVPFCGLADCLESSEVVVQALLLLAFAALSPLFASASEQALRPPSAGMTVLQQLVVSYGFVVGSGWTWV